MEENHEDECKRRTHSYKKMAHSGGSGIVYILAFIGAALYYIQQATTFGAGVVGVLKALVWPGFLVYELLKFLGA